MTQTLTITHEMLQGDLEKLFSRQHQYQGISFAELKDNQRLGEMEFSKAFNLVKKACESGAIKLDLSSQALENFSVEELVTLFSLLVDAKIKTLNLSDNQFFESKNQSFALEHLFHALQSSVTELDISDIGLGFLQDANKIKGLAKVISESRLTALHLNGNELGRWRGALVEEFLAEVSRARSLSELSLMRNSFYDLEAVKNKKSAPNLIKPFIGKRLTKLNLSLNPELSLYSAEAFNAMFSLLSETNLRDLSLNGINLGERDINEVKGCFEFLAVSGLRFLDIGDAMLNQYSAEEIKELFSRLSQSRINHLVASYLFDECIPSVEDLNSLKYGISKMQALECLDLSENDLSSFKCEEGQETAFREWYLSLLEPRPLNEINFSNSNLASVEAACSLAPFLFKSKATIVLDPKEDRTLIHALREEQERQAALARVQEAITIVANKKSYSKEELSAVSEEGRFSDDDKEENELSTDGGSFKSTTVEVDPFEAIKQECKPTSRLRWDFWNSDWGQYDSNPKEEEVDAVIRAYALGFDGYF